MQDTLSGSNPKSIMQYYIPIFASTVSSWLSIQFNNMKKEKKNSKSIQLKYQQQIQPNWLLNQWRKLQKCRDSHHMASLPYFSLNNVKLTKMSKPHSANSIYFIPPQSSLPVLKFYSPNCHNHRCHRTHLKWIKHSRSKHKLQPEQESPNSHCAHQHQP